MKQEAYVLDACRREIVLNRLHEACSRRGWLLLAAHVRTNHVHAVVGAQCKPELVMAAMKAYSSRNLNQLGLESSDTRRWARHGSTRYLWTGDAVHAVIRYVVYEQGEPMAVFEAPSLAVARGSESPPASAHSKAQQNSP
jgi:REP element-mobilizing transposase RayT